MDSVIEPKHPHSAGSILWNIYISMGCPLPCRTLWLSPWTLLPEQKGGDVHLPWDTRAFYLDWFVLKVISSGLKQESTWKIFVWKIQGFGFMFGVCSNPGLYDETSYPHGRPHYSSPLPSVSHCIFYLLQIPLPTLASSFVLCCFPIILCW